MRRRRTGRRTTRAGFVLLATLVVVGEAGHIALDDMNAVIAHHVFHMVFPLIAFAVFGLFVARDVRAHGWPRFSWRLEPAPASSRRRRLATKFGDGARDGQGRGGERGASRASRWPRPWQGVENSDEPQDVVRLNGRMLLPIAGSATFHQPASEASLGPPSRDGHTSPPRCPAPAREGSRTCGREARRPPSTAPRAGACEHRDWPLRGWQLNSERVSGSGLSHPTPPAET